jgi:hypothetical protein
MPLEPRHQSEVLMGLMLGFSLASFLWLLVLIRRGKK